MFEIYQCRECGLGLTQPLPRPEEASALYSERTSTDFQPGDAGAISGLKLFFARRDAKAFGEYSPHAKAILDYGCGNGAFTIALKEQFPAARVYGTDYHESAPEGLTRDTYIPYDALTGRTREFDLILARHVLEHVYDPVEFLSSVRRLLSPGGTLAVEVPSLNTAWRHVFGKYWDGYYVPYHPLHFTRESLALVVHSAGLKVVAEGNADMPKMGRSLRNILRCNYNPALFLAGAALQPVQVAFSVLTNTTVCLRIWASN